MTTKTDMLNQIEDLLGGEGSTELAEEMFEQLDAAGELTFDAADGYELRPADENDEDPNGTARDAWDKCLVAAIETLRAA